MRTGKKIRVLVVDDSAVFRELLTRGISTDHSIEIVATAVDAYDARDKILKYRPDVMTCDIQMPRMDGIEFIKQLLPQYSLPVIIISTISDAVFDAMNAGAVDFITKPTAYSPEDVEKFVNELVYKIKISSNATVIINNTVTSNTIEVEKADIHTDRIIAIGASTGGTEAISQIITALPVNVPGILIVQHIPPVFSRMFAERLDGSSPLEVKEAQNGDYLAPGKVIIAPGNQHMRIKRIAGKYKIECFEGAKVNGHCPSVDVLFESVAKAAGDNAIGIILTGMGYDGAKGLLEMRKKGARTIGQDEKTSVVYGMPKVAYNIGAVEKQLPLERINASLLSMLR